MTNDYLNASIAAALVQANLTFNTLVGDTGPKSIRIFELTFGLRTKAEKPADCKVSGYVAGSVLMVLAPVHLRAAKRLEISDALALRMPMVRFFAAAIDISAENPIVWIESSVPVPTSFSGDKSAAVQFPMPPWLAVPPFMTAVAAADFLLKNFPDDVSFPVESPNLPILDVDGDSSHSVTHSPRE